MKNALKTLFVSLLVTSALVDIASASSGGAAGGCGSSLSRDSCSALPFDDDVTSRVLSFLPPEDRARFGAVSTDTRRQLIKYREGGAEIAHTVERYLRYVILGKGTAPTAIEVSILRRDPEFTARRILIRIRDIMTDAKHVWEPDADVSTARAYLQTSALTPDYIQRRAPDAIPSVNNDILEHMKHRVIMSRDNTLTDADVCAFYDEYQTLDEALSHGAAVKRFVVAPHDHALLRRGHLSYFDANPDVTLVVSFDGVAIPNEWSVPWTVFRLAIIGPNVERIGDCFLASCRETRELDFSSLTRVTEIGWGFLASCRGLREVDLRPLAHVTRIDDKFLCDCIGLKEVDLRPLANVTEIGDHFLSGCRGLREVDLRPLAHVTEIGDHFLSECRGLREVDLRPLANITEISWGFLGACSGLTALDLRPLANVARIGDLFLFRCSSLESVNINGLDPTIKEHIRRELTSMPEVRLRVIEE